MEYKKKKLPKFYSDLVTLWGNHLKREQEQAVKIGEALNEYLSKSPTKEEESQEECTWKLLPNGITNTEEISLEETLDRYEGVLSNEEVERLKDFKNEHTN